MKRLSRLVVGLALLALMGLGAEVFARPFMTFLPRESGGEGSGSLELAWSTEPGIRYELQETTNFTNWTTVAGFPLEADAMAQLHTLEGAPGGLRAFRVIMLDEQAPEIVQLTPLAGAYGVSRFSTIGITLQDASAIDMNSIAFSIGEHGPFTLSHAALSFSDGQLSFSLGEAAPLGAFGDSITNSLVVADVLGNSTTHTWSYTLETEPEVVADLFVFGSAEAQMAGQSLQPEQKVMAAQVLGEPEAMYAPMSEPANPWHIIEVGEEHLLIGYEGDAPMTFHVDQRLANAAPQKKNEAFYRKVTSVEHNEANKTVLLGTRDVPLWEIVLEGAQLIANPALAIYKIAEDGLLVETGTDFSLGASYGETVTYSHGGADVTFALNGSATFRPEIDISFNLQGHELEDFYMKASGDFLLEGDFNVIVSGGVSYPFTPPPFFKQEFIKPLGAIGPVPIWAQVKFELGSEVGVAFDAATEVGFDFYYNRGRSFAVTYSQRDPSLCGWKTDSWSDLGTRNTAPVFVTDLNGKAWAKLIPKVDVRLMHLAGGKVSLPTGVELNANAKFLNSQLYEYNWDLTAFIDLKADFSIVFVDGDILPYTRRLFGYTWDGPASPEFRIVTHPVSQTVQTGNEARFSVSTSGGSGLNYQWYQNGRLLPGENKRELVIRNANSGHSGIWYVRVHRSGVGIDSRQANLTVSTSSGGGSTGGDYMVIDLSGGPSASSYPVSYLSAPPSGGWTDEYKTTKLIMRRIPAGTFTMGSPSGELGRYSNEAQRQVTLTKDYYMGVFEVTQRQWELVMWNKPSYFNNASYYASRPVEQVSYYDIRENADSNTPISPNWPQSSAAGASSFVGKLRAKTGLTTLDLPTEAQWENACRAGTTTALNSGKNLTNTGSCPNMDEVGRYWYNGGSGYTQGGNTSVGTTKVGSYLPNAWGLYDMHGNVWEWCLDWYEAYHAATTDPLGAASGSSRVLRGGGWRSVARSCRSASRSTGNPDYRYYSIGFRLSRTLP